MKLKLFNLHFNRDTLFYIGVFLIPFDNLIFAPSSGWATIAPLFFFAYIVWNFKNIRIKSNKILGFSIVLMFIAAIAIILNGISLGAFIETIGTIVLGASFYFSLYIFFVSHKNKLNVFVRVITIAYLIAYLFGVLSIVGIDFTFLEKRHYDKLQYTFTEPSFISIHLYGIILPIILLLNNYCKKECHWLTVLLFLFIVTTIVFGSSLRFILDTAVIGLIFCLCNINKIRLSYIIWLLGIIALPIVLILISRFAISNSRINKIFNLGIYADASLSARFFLINSSIKGIKGLGWFTGYGIGNAYIPFQAGYEAAFLEYKNGYFDEILSYKGQTNISIYCLWIRILSEFGLPALLVILFFLYDKKHFMLFFMMLYLYIQFDSYMFYLIWLYLFFVKNYQVKAYDDVYLVEPQKKKRKFKIFSFQLERMVSANGKSCCHNSDI